MVAGLRERAADALLRLGPGVLAEVGEARSTVGLLESLPKISVYYARWLPQAAHAGAGLLVAFTALCWLDARSAVIVGLTVVLSIVTVFLGLFPNVLPSSLGAAYNLTIRNAASQPYTLHLMTVVGAIFLPLIVGYQLWNYYVFRRRIEVDEKEGRQAAGGEAAR